METMIKEINSQRSLWKSKLVTSLECSVKKQWEPIIHDHKQMLQTVGSQLFALGLVEVIGRPILMLYPLYLAANDLLNIATEFEVKKTVSLSSVVQLGKLFVMSMAILQISNILAMYSGVGYTCLAIGFLALFISSNDELTKHFVPILAPHIAHAGTFFAKLSHLEQMTLSTLSLTTANAAAAAAAASVATTASRTRAHQSSSSTTVTDPRVEELPDDPTAHSRTSTAAASAPPAAASAPPASPLAAWAPGRDDRFYGMTDLGVGEAVKKTWTTVGEEGKENEEYEEEGVEDEEEEQEEEEGYVFAEVVEVDPVATDIAGVVHASLAAADGLRQRRR
jgi:hypothetical protein